MIYALFIFTLLVSAAVLLGLVLLGIGVFWAGSRNRGATRPRHHRSG